MNVNERGGECGDEDEDDRSLLLQTRVVVVLVVHLRLSLALRPRPLVPGIVQYTFEIFISPSTF